MLALLILVLAVYTILTSEVTSISFLFSALVLMLYVVPYFTLWNDFVHLGFLSEKGGGGFFVLIASSFAAFLIGTRLYKPAAVEEQKAMLQQFVIDQQKYELYSIIVGVIGFAGYGYFIIRSGADYYGGHTSGDYSVGGYIYELRFFLFSSFLLLFQSFLNKTISKKALYFLIAVFLFLCWDAYIKQQRGSWIRFGVIILLSYLYHEQSLKKIRIATLIARYKSIFILGVFFAFLLGFTVQMRQFYSPNTSFSEQVSATFNYIVNDPQLLIGGSGIDEGNEFVTAYNAYRSNYAAGTYDYGYKWLYPFLNFVPRALWKDKPTWFTFSTDVFAIMDKYVVFHHAPGSAETGIVDAFYRFFYLAPLFFLGFGYYCKKLQTRAKDDLGARLFYICFFVGCFYFITQNMMPFVVFTLYMYIPVWFVIKKTYKPREEA